VNFALSGSLRAFSTASRTSAGGSPGSDAGVCGGASVFAGTFPVFFSAASALGNLHKNSVQSSAPHAAEALYRPGNHWGTAMRKLTYALIAAAVVLGFLSVFLAGLAVDYGDPSAHRGLLYLWFYVLPMLVDRIFLPDSDAGMIVLAWSVYTAQYLALFALTLSSRTLIRDFWTPYRHRTGLG
jgi:hypothetical protein